MHAKVDDRCYKKKLNEIFIYVFKIICLPNFSSLGWFLFLSAVNSCWQLLTADDSCHKQNLNGIFIYPLKLIPVPNFSSLGWFSFLSAVNSCWQLLTADDSCHKKSLNGIFIYPLKLIPVPNFSSPGCLGAQLESVTHGRTDARTYGRTPGEYSANSGPAGLVPGPELSNKYSYRPYGISGSTPASYFSRLLFELQISASLLQTLCFVLVI